MESHLRQLDNIQSPADSDNRKNSNSISLGLGFSIRDDSPLKPKKDIEAVQVFVRIRPPFKSEIEDTIFNPQKKHSSGQWNCTFTDPHDYQSIELMIPKDQPKEMKFDQVFDDSADQGQIFENTCLPLVLQVLNGYNGTYFVYGQTGTGKTHTMGVLQNINAKSQGIIPQSIEFILKYLQQEKERGNVVEWHVHLSFYQIYLDQIQDLLNPEEGKNLQIREENDGEIFVERLVEVPIQTVAQAVNIINAGMKFRQMAAQRMNETSSRSHTILHIDVYQTRQFDEDQIEQVQARLVLVDLAGSERVRRTTSKGQRLEEAKHINASLSTLGNVIQNLATIPKKFAPKQFIPYRSSKLTRVLQNSLSASSKIVLLATLGPHHRNYQESLSTLQFAKRCKSVTLSPVQNSHVHLLDIDPNEVIAQLKYELSEKTSELEHVKQQAQTTNNDFLAKIQQLQKNMENLSAVNKLAYQQSQDHQYQINNMRQSEISSDRQYSYTKLADFVIFLMKLIQRLESQSHANLMEHNIAKTKDPIYVEQRQVFQNMNLPKNPEDLLRFIVEDQIYIDKNIMPQVLQMAKTHVEAINIINGTLKQKLSGSINDGLKKQLQSLQQENQELQQVLGQRNGLMTSLNAQVSESNKKYQTAIDENFSQKKEIFNMKQKISELEKQVMQLKEINQELLDDMPDIQQSHENNIQIFNQKQIISKDNFKIPQLRRDASAENRKSPDISQFKTALQPKLVEEHQDSIPKFTSISTSRENSNNNTKNVESKIGADRLMQLSLALQNRCFDKLNNFFLQDNTKMLDSMKQLYQNQESEIFSDPSSSIIENNDI